MTEHDVVARIPRNIILGIAIMYAITVGAALLAGLAPGLAMGVAAMPGLFAGPFIGGMIIMNDYRRIEGGGH